MTHNPRVGAWVNPLLCWGPTNLPTEGQSVAKTRHAWGPFDGKYPLISKVHWQPLTHMAFTHVVNVTLE
jgi:hypothetical protein